MSAIKEIHYTELVKLTSEERKEKLLQLKEVRCDDYDCKKILGFRKDGEDDPLQFCSIECYFKGEER